MGQERRERMRRLGPTIHPPFTAAVTTPSPSPTGSCAPLRSEIRPPHQSAPSSAEPRVPRPSPLAVHAPVSVPAGCRVARPAAPAKISAGEAANQPSTVRRRSMSGRPASSGRPAPPSKEGDAPSHPQPYELPPAPMAQPPPTAPQK
eukprot:scaffold6949_cov94-Isochrysis_galbana.AAC.7